MIRSLKESIYRVAQKTGPPYLSAISDFIVRMLYKVVQGGAKTGPPYLIANILKIP